MVNTTVDKISPTRAKLTLVVTPEELRPAIDEAYKTIANQLNIPGFRKGKVPPAIIDQRIGREAVLQQAVGEGLDGFYREALRAEKITPISRPEADVTVWPNEKDFSGDLTVTVEVDIRPEVQLPAYDSLKVEVDAIAVTPDEVEDELTQLRQRFATLVSVDRPAAKGDLTVVNLEASINGVVVDTANEVTYELGSGELIEGIDEALETLTAGESTTFESNLLGGEHEGETAQIAVTLVSVKERELPTADDDFAQIASPFDTIGELRADLKERLEKQKGFNQLAQARQKLIDQLIETVDIPVPTELIEEGVKAHIEREGKTMDDPHAAEVRETDTRNFKVQVILDQIAEEQNFQVAQQEISDYVLQSASQYGMDPNEFVAALREQGQLGQLVGDIARSKAGTFLVVNATVVDSDGKAVDTSEIAASLKAANEAAEAEHDGHEH